METEIALIEMTRLVKEFALGSVTAQDFIDRYSNLYYYEALDGHEASGLLRPDILAGLGSAIELYRRIQEAVVNKILLDAGF